MVVVGEAGIGKSRLLAAAEARARAAGLAWTWTENVSYGRGEPYRFARLFAQTVADEHGVDSGNFTRRLIFTEDLTPEDARRLGGAIAAIARDASFTGWEEEAPYAPIDPAEVASGLTDVARRYIDRLLTLAGPRAVVIDDLHWLDPSSVTLVDLLVEATADRPLVLLAGTRPTGYPAWVDRPDVHRIDLAGLAEPETPGWRRSSLGPPSRPTGSGASTSDRRGTRCSSGRRSGRSSRTGRSSGGMDGSR